MTNETKFLQALKDIFVGATVEGKSGFINLMRIKARYFERGVFPRLMGDINEAVAPFPGFREELFDKLYDFFHRYFSESGSIYFRYTPLHERVYEKVYTDERDVALFYKTHMLYYVKTDRLFHSMDVVVDGLPFRFDVSALEHKRANEKRAPVFEFQERRSDNVLVLAVTYSENGRKTKLDDMVRAVRRTGVRVDEETLERAMRLFERQSEVDYFINKDARAFLREQFDLWLYQYVFEPEQRSQTLWNERRIRQLQVLKDTAYKIIDFIAQFEDELVRIWNKPKFVRGSHYIVTLERVAGQGAAGQALLARFLAHPNSTAQVQEWRELGMVGEDFAVAQVWAGEGTERRLDESYQFLPLDTRHFADLEGELAALFDHLDDALDGWLIRSENYQALATLKSKFRRRVNCIYIDPPYNTGGDEFIYYDQFQHASWLTMIENRLRGAHDSLTRDGVLLASIGREEVFELKQVLDEVFGGDNQIGDLVWEKGRKNDAKYFSLGHDYLLVYACDEQFLSNNNIVWREEKPGAHEILEEFRHLKALHGTDFSVIEKGIRGFYDSLPKGHLSLKHRRYNRVDANGLWRDDNMSWPGGEGPRYDVIHPVTRKPCRVPDGGWRFATFDKFRLYEKHGFIEYREDDSEPPILKRYLNYVSTDFDPDSKRRRNTLSDGEEESNVQVMPSVFYKNQQPPVLELRHIMGGEVFRNPKDPQVLSRLFAYVTNRHGCFLDFFAGSGTTAHAVMNLNREDDGQRKYILVEMGEHFENVIIPRIKKIAFSDQWRDGQAQAGGRGISHFVKYFTLEQYEDVLSRAVYGDAEPLFIQADPYSQYVFLRDLKLLDNAETSEQVMTIDPAADAIHVHLERLYPDIDVAETLSCVTGKRIRRLAQDEVEFEDGQRMSLLDPPWDAVKPLIWW